MAEPAKVYYGFFGDSDRDIGLGQLAGLTDVGKLRLELNSTHRAKDHCLDLIHGFYVHC